MRLKDLSVSTKIVIAFAVVLSVTVALGLFAVRNLGVVNSEAEILRTARLPAVQMIGQYQYYWARYRADEAAAGLENAAGTALSEEQIRYNLYLIDKWRGKADTLWKKYQPLIETQQEKALVDKINHYREIYLQKNQTYRELIQNDPKAAVAFYRGEENTAYDNFILAIKDDVALNTKNADATAQAGAAAYHQALTLIYIALGLAALICAVFGALLVRGISKPLTTITELMGQLANGKLNINVPYADQEDEVGRLAGTMATFKNKLLNAQNDREKAEADRIRAAEEQKRAEADTQHQSEQLVVGTFGAGLKALAEERLDYRLTADVPAAYVGLKQDFNTAMETADTNRRQREEDARQRERDRATAEAAQKQAEEAARQRGIALVVSSFGEGMKALAARNLTYRIDKELPAEYLGLQKDFNDAMHQLDSAMQEIHRSAGEIAGNCNEIRQGAREMAQRTERQAASLEETSAAVNEITATVTKSSEGAAQASDKAAASKKSAEHGNDIAGRAVDAMREIARSSSEITNIIAVIDEIAFQTNLLALNAGVEAARAGEAGRGFAVVASEVRALAQRSAEASKEIKALIKNSEMQVETGVKLVEESGTALQQIVADITTISQLVGDIAHSQGEQARGLSEIDMAVSDMDKSTQQNAAMAEQSNAASEALTGFALEMENLVSKFEISDH